MAGTVTNFTRSSSDTTQAATLAEPRWVRFLLTSIALLFIALFLLIPLAAVFAYAFEKGWEGYKATFSDKTSLHAIWLTIVVAAIAVPLNVFFGVVAAWAITKFRFHGKQFLITLIDLPFSVSPVIAGLVFVLLFGRHGTLGPWLQEHNLQIIFAVPGLVLATTFVTFPFVARELIPLMQAQGNEEELAARTLGASAWQTFYRVTLPNIKWGLFHGIILCNARAMGEFGAVAVVSGLIRGVTCTMPLQIEVLYQDYQTVAAFTLASLLTLLAIITLIAKVAAHALHHRRQAQAEAEDIKYSAEPLPIIP